MPNTRLSMRKLKEVIRLKKAAGLSNRQIADSCAISRATVANYLQRAEQVGIDW
ncbi:MAG: sigma-70 region 4 domain-containing protein, partial [Magnetococcales bacterium]|nr:sigma-70 region 4 domain-containing protein [Magnetococcales bacterium]